MNEGKITIALVVVLVVLATIFKTTVLSDSYVAGSSPSTLQSTLETGSVANITTKNLMELTATASYDGIQITQGNGSGDGLQITGQANALQTGSLVHLLPKGLANPNQSKGVYIDNTGLGSAIHIYNNTGNYADPALKIQNINTASTEAVDVTCANANFSYPCVKITGGAGGVNNLKLINNYASAWNDQQIVFDIQSTVASSANDSFKITTYGNITAGHNATTDTTNLYYGLTDIDTAGIRERNTNNSTNGMIWEMERAPKVWSATAGAYVSGVADGDYIGSIKFTDFGDADVGFSTATEVTYANIDAYIGVASTTAETGYLDFQVATVSGGGLVSAISIDGDYEAVRFSGYTPPVIPPTATSSHVCDASTQGMMVLEPNSGTGDDVPYICMQLNGSSFAWKAISIVP